MIWKKNPLTQELQYDTVCREIELFLIFEVRLALPFLNVQSVLLTECTLAQKLL